MTKHLKYAVGLAALLMTSACAFDGKLSRPEATADPYENFNRKVFAFNESFYDNVMFPIAKGYRKVTTPFVRERVNSFLSNAKEPVTAANYILQLKFTSALKSIGRFVVNTTMGLGGLFDVAPGWKLERKDTSFNETLASWCVAEGPYIVLPFLGASSPRSLTGTVVDAVADPVYWATYKDSNISAKISYPYTAMGYIAFAETYQDIYNDLKQNSVDFYSTLRSAHMQKQKGYKCRFAPEAESESYDFDFDENFDETDAE